MAQRRDKVLDLNSMGYGEIASYHTLQSLEMSLKTAGQENIGRYIDEQLPAEYHKCLIGVTE